MQHRRFAVPCIAMIAVLLLAAPVLAQNAKKYAVLPFSYNGPKKYSYFPKAFQASLNSDLEWTGHAEPAADSTVEGLAAPKSKADAANTLRGASLDYLITGSISILDKKATLKMTSYDVNGNTWEQKGQMGIDEITPWLEEQSKAIMGDVFQRPGYSTAEKSVDKQDLKDEVSGPINAEFVGGTSGSYQASTLNPQFRYEGGSNNIGRWRSQTLRFFSTSMVVSDADGDGKNEVFILHKTGISAYRFQDGKLAHLDTLALTPSTQYIRLEAMDVNKDNLPDLIIGTYQSQYRNVTMAPEGWPKSHILSFKGGKFSYLVKNYNKFLGVLRVPPTFAPVLVAQRKGERHLFHKRIYEAYLKGDSVETGSTIPCPPYGNVYNMTYLPEEFGYRYVIIDDFHRLRVYSQAMERLYTTEEDHYNSSGIGITTPDRPAGMGAGIADIKVSTFNVPFRMLAASFHKKGKYELLVNKDLSVAAQVFEKFRYFSQGEIHALSWDGVGLNLAWKTRRIKGQVSDIALADLNNDGKKQLVVLLNTFPGSMGFSKRKTVVTAYDLNMP